MAAVESPLVASVKRIETGGLLNWRPFKLFFLPSIKKFISSLKIIQKKSFCITLPVRWSFMHRCSFFLVYWICGHEDWSTENHFLLLPMSELESGRKEGDSSSFYIDEKWDQIHFRSFGPSLQYNKASWGLSLVSENVIQRRKWQKATNDDAGNVPF